jgi:hypothetical protein
MLGHDLALTRHHDPVRGRGDLDEPADHPRIDGVVGGVDTHVAVPGEPDPLVQPNLWIDWW